MSNVILILPVVITSGVAYLLGRRVLGLPRTTLRLSLVHMLECLGISAVFFVLDTLIGSVVILALRELTPYFFALYVMADTTLIPLALFQGLAFWGWFRAPRQA